jgi:hypothetical protein
MCLAVFLRTWGRSRGAAAPIGGAGTGVRGFPHHQPSVLTDDTTFGTVDPWRLRTHLGSTVGFHRCSRTQEEGSTMNALSSSRPAHAPNLNPGLLDSWIEGWAIALNGARDCFEAILAGGPGALDVPRWMELTMTRKPPSWTTPHEIVFEDPIARLRDFSRSPTPGLVPTLVLPPQAGHDSCIVDYSDEQSQMQAILASGLESAFSLDWIGATDETKDASIEDYLEVIHHAVEHCGGRVNLIGDCQGGWLATIYAALYPEQIKHAHACRSADRLPRRRAGRSRSAASPRSGRRSALL